MTFATLVLIDEDTAVNLVRFVQNYLGDEDSEFEGSCKKFIENKKGVELVAAILSKSGTILALEDENAIEGCFHAIVSVILRYGEDNGSKNLSDLLSILSSDKGNQQRLRLKILLTAFNLVTNESNKYNTAMTIFQYALDTQQAADVAGFHTRVKEWCDSWTSLSAEQKQQLFLLVRRVLLATPNTASSSDARAFFLHYLRTFAQDQPLPASACGTETLDAVVEFCKTPVDCIFERDALLGALTEAQVRNVEALQQLRSLLSIFCNGDFRDFKKFLSNSSNANALKQYEMDTALLETNMRVVTLCSLASSKDVLAYDEIAKCLEIAEEEVEVWVIECIASNVLEAAVDQMTRRVTVSRCSYREFGSTQWNDVQRKLNALRGDISHIFNDIRSRATS